MHIEGFRDYCIAKPGTTEEMPFGNDVLVFKVLGKMYALADIHEFSHLSLKCDPERAISLREKYENIRPGYHLSKVHWNTIYIDGTLSDQLLSSLIDHSYELVAASLSKKLRDQLQ